MRQEGRRQRLVALLERWAAEDEAMGAIEEGRDDA